MRVPGFVATSAQSPAPGRKPSPAMVELEMSHRGCLAVVATPPLCASSRRHPQSTPARHAQCGVLAISAASLAACSAGFSSWAWLRFHGCHNGQTREPFAQASTSCSCSRPAPALPMAWQKPSPWQSARSTSRSVDGETIALGEIAELVSPMPRFCSSSAIDQSPAALAGGLRHLAVRSPVQTRKSPVSRLVPFCAVGLLHLASIGRMELLHNPKIIAEFKSQLMWLASALNYLLDFIVCDLIIARVPGEGKYRGGHRFNDPGPFKLLSLH